MHKYPQLLLYPSFSPSFQQVSVTMIDTSNPYSLPSKTAKIMSRYRPIVPKPVLSENSMAQDTAMTQKMSQSLKNIWAKLQTRPTRTRKRGRGSLTVLSPSFKKSRVIGFSSPPRNLSFQGFSPEVPVTATSASLMAPLPSLSSPPYSVSMVPEEALGKDDEKRFRDIDLNRVAEIPEEKNPPQQPQGPVIAPHPIRPVRSRITVGWIIEQQQIFKKKQQLPTKAEEAEEELELDTFPAVITDSKNKVRAVNSAYKEMVGQPKCSWLRTLIGGGKCERISGEVNLEPRNGRIPVWSNGFSCWVRIEWGSGEGKTRWVNASCDVIRIFCNSKDYDFVWRFHIHHW